MVATDARSPRAYFGVSFIPVPLGSLMVV